MLKKVVIGVALLVTMLLVVVVMQPDQYRVERSMTVRAPAEVVYAQLDDFHRWSQWSPWEKLDPAMKKTYSGPVQGLGASYAWEGNDEVGKGRMTITEARAFEALTTRLEFLEPFPSVAQSGFTLEGEGQGTKVTWWMQGDNNFMGKAFGLFMDMDTMIGADFEKGLSALGAVSSREAERRRAEAAAAAQAAAAPQQPDTKEVQPLIDGPAAPAP